jgi:AmmeMemoRadiSam system protein B
MFYPADANQLATMVDGYLAAATPDPHAPTPKAIIAPHAGYPFSGPVAASVYSELAGHQDTIKKVTVVAPAHRYPFKGLAVSEAEWFRTPLGDIPVDQQSLQQLREIAGVTTLDAAFEGEHSLEVQLPFLQRLLSNFQLIPIIVGEAEPALVQRALDTIWGGDETLIVVSSDLSHFLDYDSARARDARTSQAIERLDHRALDFHDACGRLPVSGLLMAAKARDLSVTTLDLRNSGDTAGNRERVVGYGAYRVA